MAGFGMRRLRETDNNRIAKACGAVIVNRPHQLQQSDVGTGAGIFEVKTIGDEFFAFIVDCKEPKACTVLLRGPSKDQFNEVERNLQDAMSVARNILKNPKLGPGGGATQLTVSATLKQKSSSVEGIEKWPYEAAAIAFEPIPRTLAPNCGVNVIRTMTALPGKIWDACNVKAQSFKTAIEAACLLLRIDDIVSGMKKKQPPGPKAPSKPQVETEGDADNEQIIPDRFILSLWENARVAYKHGTALEGGKIADSEPVDLFSSAHNIRKAQAQAHHNLHDEDSNHNQSQMKQDELNRRE
ncbi:T-complex protein 1 subunit gamma-like [Prunus dulcis]|uniref:T-complex protein 1 subunit gamma-like n=1 Tax=Prunus dulcis TaxID=3755 RepID=UPI0014823C88|nr:T-complex protein 1 subunit gamma-like [Prunus dulcis]